MSCTHMDRKPSAICDVMYTSTVASPSLVRLLLVSVF
jgi:hypothetical protein